MEPEQFVEVCWRQLQFWEVISLLNHHLLIVNVFQVSECLLVKDVFFSFNQDVFFSFNVAIAFNQNTREVSSLADLLICR